MQLRYRADIDGLRAIAVVAVILFHADVPGFGGGFFGVDIFFVISGFLITQMLLGADASRPWQAIGQFYERRVRRIVPALALVLIATSAAALVMLGPVELRRFAASDLSAAAFVANLYFILAGGNYFAATARDTPLLHLWSLAIEEQFYVFYPLILLCLMRWASRRVTVLVIAGLAVLSLAMMVVLQHFQPPIAFYFTGSRGWELLLGALAAFVPAQRVSGPLREAGGALGLALAVAPLLVSLPLLAAVLPCMGAFLLIVSGEPTVAGRALGTPAMRGIGLISYSLYLWHWPVFFFFGRIVLRAPSPVETAALIAASFVLAWLSWRFVEQPFRRTVTRRTLFAAAAAAGVAIVAFALTVKFTHGLPERFSAGVVKADSYLFSSTSPEYKKAFQIDACFVKRRQAAHVCYDPVPGKTNVLLWGDSHAMHYYPGLKMEAERHGVHLIQATMAACQPILRSRHECADFNRRVMDTLDNRTSVVILSAHWEGSRPISDSLYRESIQALVKRGFRVVVLGPSIEYQELEPLYIERYLEIGDNSLLNAAPKLIADLTVLDNSLADAFGHLSGVAYISVLQTLCPHGACPMMIAGAPTHIDHDHLSLEGARWAGQMLWPKLWTAIMPPRDSSPQH